MNLNWLNYLNWFGWSLMKPVLEVIETMICWQISPCFMIQMGSQSNLLFHLAGVPKIQTKVHLGNVNGQIDMQFNYFQILWIQLL